MIDVEYLQTIHHGSGRVVEWRGLEALHLPSSHRLGGPTLGRAVKMGLRKISQCPEMAPTVTFALLKVPC